PTLWPALCLGRAEAGLLVVDCALSVRSAPWTLTFEPGSTRALAWVLVTSMASAPATPTAAPLGPAGAPTRFTMAGIAPVTLTAGAVTFAVPPRDARLLAAIRPIATATPTPVPEAPLAGDPSAVVIAGRSAALAESVSGEELEVTF